MPMQRKEETQMDANSSRRAKSEDGRNRRVMTAEIREEKHSHDSQKWGTKMEGGAARTVIQQIEASSANRILNDSANNKIDTFI